MTSARTLKFLLLSFLLSLVSVKERKQSDGQPLCCGGESVWSRSSRRSLHFTSVIPCQITFGCCHSPSLWQLRGVGAWSRRARGFVTRWRLLVVQRSDAALTMSAVMGRAGNCKQKSKQDIRKYNNNNVNNNNNGTFQNSYKVLYSLK